MLDTLYLVYSGIPKKIAREIPLYPCYHAGYARAPRRFPYQGISPSIALISDGRDTLIGRYR